MKHVQTAHKGGKSKKRRNGRKTLKNVVGGFPLKNSNGTSVVDNINKTCKTNAITNVATKEFINTVAETSTFMKAESLRVNSSKDKMVGKNKVNDNNINISKKKPGVHKKRHNDNQVPKGQENHKEVCNSDGFKRRLDSQLVKGGKEPLLSGKTNAHGDGNDEKGRMEIISFVHDSKHKKESKDDLPTSKIQITDSEKTSYEKDDLIPEFELSQETVKLHRKRKLKTKSKCKNTGGAFVQKNPDVDLNENLDKTSRSSTEIQKKIFEQQGYKLISEAQKAKKITVEHARQLNDIEDESNIICAPVKDNKVKRIIKTKSCSLLENTDSPICVEMEGIDSVINHFGNSISKYRIRSSKPVITFDWNINVAIQNTDKCEAQVSEKSCRPLSDLVDKRNVSVSERNVNASQSEGDTEKTQKIPRKKTRPGYYHLFQISKLQSILALPQGHTLYFNGALKIKVLVGVIEVLGYKISNKIPQTIFSPKGHSLISIHAVSQELSVVTQQHLKSIVKAIGREESEIKSETSDMTLANIPKFTSLILLERVSNSLISLVNKYFYNKYFSVALNKPKNHPASSLILRAQFFKPSKSVDGQYFNPREEWRPLIKFLLNRKPGDLRVLVCGGKDVGKSTFLRFLTNQTLSKYQPILYVDLDPGQCEFTPPGCLSAVLVKMPLLGPNFTHVTEPERSVYIGEVNMENCPIKYLESIQYILNWCSSQEDLASLPWFINTMGHVKGIGEDLTKAVIKLANPTDLVQIQSYSSGRNFSTNFTLDVIKESKMTLFTPDKKHELNYSFHLMPCASEKPSRNFDPKLRMPARYMRDCAIAAYFSQVVHPPAFSLLQVIPHVLPFSEVKLCICHQKINYSDYLSAMNASLVGLCDVRNTEALQPSHPGFPEILKEVPLCLCYGFGIVRGIDMESQLIFIISPISASKFRYVNCLVLGSVQLPNSFYTAQDEAEGSVPYVAQGVKLPLAKQVSLAKESKHKKERLRALALPHTRKLVCR